MTTKEGRHGGGDQGRGMRHHKGENKCDFSCRRKEAMSFARRSLSGNLFQRVGAALRNDLAPERFVFMEKSSEENISKRLEGGQGSSYTAKFCTSDNANHHSRKHLSKLMV